MLDMQMVQAIGTTAVRAGKQKQTNYTKNINSR